MLIDSILRTSPVMPVIVIDQVEQAVPLAKALLAGGIRVLEVTLRTPAALEGVRRIRAEVPDAIVGTGTVTNPTELQASIAAGAVFAVSPGLTPALLAAAKDAPIPLLPGVMTPSELMLARDAGFSHPPRRPAASNCCRLSMARSPTSDSAPPAASRCKPRRIIWRCRMCCVSVARG